jgi:hypothetical protein
MKYIFVAGAPGSKWSSVVKNIYYSHDIDRSDYADERTYYHDASGKLELMHLGAYFDPGMEFGDFFDNIENHTKEECEAEFDRAFSGKGVRIIKSHVFANHVEFLKKHWPDCPIILVHRANDACLGWWVKCGHFNITYPSYSKYYKDLRVMAEKIAEQNKNILESWWKYNKKNALETNVQLAQSLGIEIPPTEYSQNYVVSDIRVKVI